MVPLDLAILDTPTWTGDAAAPWTNAVGVQGDRIVALGDEVAPLVGSATRVLRGGMALSGFQDAHVHPPFAGRNLLTVDLNDVMNREEILARIAAYAEAHPDAEWITGGGWAMEVFEGGTPSRADLDAIVPDRPVFLLNRDVHGAWVNSEALRRAGIDASTPDPPDGRIERLPGGREPQGSLHEGAAYAFQDVVVPAPSTADWKAAILAAQTHLHSLGITGWQDAWVTPDTQRAYEELAVSGQLTARVVGALWWDRHRGVEQIEDLVARRDRFSHNRFRPTTVKIMVDGVIENQTGSLLQPYCGHDHNGLMYVDRETLLPAVRELAGRGFQVHLHAIGDGAVRSALDAVEQAGSGTDLRHTIAHLQIVHPDDLARFARLGVVANCQTYWAQSEPQMDELTIPVIGDERAAQQYPFATLDRLGVRLAMGSDWPVTTANPLEQIEVAVRRVDPENRSNAPFLPAERLPLEVALSAFTAGSAYVNHDDEAGVIAVGRRADLAVLDANVFEVDYVAEASVVGTVAAGRVVFER
ncbi:amidohydrolase [Calidifontibacter terrae]